MRLPLIIFFLLLSFNCVFAQQKTIDSLQHVRATEKDPESNAMILVKIADLELNLNNDSALVHAEQALKTGLAEKNEIIIAKSKLVIGSVKMYAGDHDGARKEFKAAEAIGNSEGNKEILGDAIHNQANVFRSAGQFDSARFYFEKSYEIRKSLNDDTRLGASLTSIGACYYHLGDLKKALEYYYEAIPFREKAKDTRGLATIYTNICLVHLDRKDKASALSANNKAYRLYQEMQNQNKLGQAENNYGIIYVNEFEYDSALYWYTQSLNRRLALGDSAGLSEVYNNIGNVYTLQKDYINAYRYYNLALSVPGYADAWHIYPTLCNFAIAASHIGKPDSAKWALDKARRVINEMGNLPDMMVAYHGSAVDYYEAIGELDSALYHSRAYITLSDSLYRSETARQMTEMEAKFETAKKERAIEMLKKDQEKKDLQILASLIGIGLLVVLVSYVIYGNIQRRKVNVLLAQQNELISEKNKDITDSINYAQRIQQSVLSDQQILFRNTTDAFITYLPRDIVSGDFYWFRESQGKLYAACADCTGHGVPGALVSVVGINILNQILDATPSISTGELLNQLHRNIINALNKDSRARDSYDGMDIAVIRIDKPASEIQFSGASRPLLMCSKEKTELIRGDKYSIGGVKDLDDATSFTTHTFTVKNSSLNLYMFTDGYADQFGGKEGKKFMSKRFTELLASSSTLSMQEQKTNVEHNHTTWRGNLDQVDDICVVGIRI